MTNKTYPTLNIATTNSQTYFVYSTGEPLFESEEAIEAMEWAIEHVTERIIIKKGMYYNVPFDAEEAVKLGFTLEY